MKKKFKIIILVFLTLIIVIISFIGFGLLALGIEDNYGDLQNVYYKTKNGDIIINETSKNIGVVKKTWKSISIITKEKDTFDLWFWENEINENPSKIYRPKNKIKIEKLTYYETKVLIKTKKLKFLIDCKIE